MASKAIAGLGEEGAESKGPVGDVAGAEGTNLEAPEPPAGVVEKGKAELRRRRKRPHLRRDFGGLHRGWGLEIGEWRLGNGSGKRERRRPTCEKRGSVKTGPARRRSSAGSREKEAIIHLLGGLYRETEREREREKRTWYMEFEAEVKWVFNWEGGLEGKGRGDKREKREYGKW
ncbi:hypothetical protein HPP92_024241 [Vanilla planifolia]|uniref:Uncharacterized protein n=1 Tax=Vanilla planifolia TaxID=51239 RepID=A0A835PNK0_VANPL|nr:hypothetical protein HPP92_024241 [Vanilla planifolia]